MAVASPVVMSLFAKRGVVARRDVPGRARRVAVDGNRAAESESRGAAGLGAVSRNLHRDVRLAASSLDVVTAVRDGDVAVLLTPVHRCDWLIAPES